jgi:hypothetical protein
MRRISKFGLLIALLAILLSGRMATAAIITIDVDPTADLTQGRSVATITGSIECDVAAATVNILVYVIQTGGRLLNIGIYSGSTACAGPVGGPYSGDFSIPVPAIQGLQYKSGPATVIVKANDGSGTDYEMGFKTRLHPTNNP